MRTTTVAEIIAARCDALIADIDVPRPFDMDEFLAVLARRRGKPIEIVPGRAGLVISTAAVDYVFVAGDVALLHKLHASMHEIGHLLFGHGRTHAISDAALRTLMPSLPLATTRRILRIPAAADAALPDREGLYSTREETEAEFFASRMVARIRSPRSVGAPIPAPRRGGNMVTRLESVFGTALHPVA